MPTILVQLEAYDDDEEDADDGGIDPNDVIGMAGGGHFCSPESPRDIILAIPPTHYMEYTPSDGKNAPRIYFKV